MNQLETARRIADEMGDDGHNVSALDLLDYMGIVGVEFTEGSAASEAHVKAVVEAARETDDA